MTSRGVTRRGRPYLAWALGALGAAASWTLTACGALLDLDVQYIGATDGATATADGGPATDGAADDGTIADGAPPDHATPALDGAAALDARDSAPGAEAGAELDAAEGDPELDAPAETSAATPAFVQDNAGEGASGATMAMIPFQAAVTAHDTIVVAFDYDAAPTITVTDTLNDTFQVAVGPVGNGVNCMIWYALDVAGGPDTVIFTASYAPPTFFEIYVHEYSGISAFDVGSSQNSTAVTSGVIESGFVPTSVPNELLFGFAATGTATAGVGFTTRSQFNENLTEDMIAATAGPHEATATANGSGWVMSMAAFRPR